MATTLNFKDIIDLPLWRMEAPTLAASAAGMCLASDLRNDETRNPYIFLLRSATALDKFDPTTGEWLALSSPALAGTFGAGATAVFHPTQGPRGTITTGATTTSVVLSTVLPAAVGINQLANKGTGSGYRIRIVGSSAGGSGLIEERTIVGNTGGTAPTIYLDSALSFTPAAGDTYEILSGRLFMLSAGVLAAGIWKYYDVATNSYSGNLATTNLPATIGIDSCAIAMSEAYVSNTAKPGEGFVTGGGTYGTTNTFGCIEATAASGTTITGSGMPGTLLANEFSNFQVRIVSDSTTPTAVGQRRKITSHTSGATGVFTVSAFAVTPSATAKFVVENNDDLIFCRSTATTSTYTYNITGNTWDTTTIGANGGGVGAGGMMAQAFGITRDTTGNVKQGMIYVFRGANGAVLDVYDLGSATWSNASVYGNSGQTFTTGNSACYDPVTLDGRFLYININGTQRMARFDLRNRILDPNTYLRLTQGTAVVGGKMATALFIDGSTKLTFVYQLLHTLATYASLMIQR